MASNCVRMLLIVLKSWSGVRNPAWSEEKRLNRWDQVGVAERLREIREDLYGEHGASSWPMPGDPVQTWLNYESGVMTPADVVLPLIVIARVNPHWLLTGQGEKHDHRNRQLRPATAYREPINGRNGDPWLDEWDSARSPWGLSGTRTCNRRKWPGDDPRAPGRVDGALRDIRIVGSRLREWVAGD